MFCLDAASRGHLQHSLDTHSWGTKTKQRCLLYEYRVSYVLGLLTAQGNHTGTQNTTCSISWQYCFSKASRETIALNATVKLLDKRETLLSQFEAEENKCWH